MHSWGWVWNHARSNVHPCRACCSSSTLALVTLRCHCFLHLAFVFACFARFARFAVDAAAGRVPGQRQGDVFLLRRKAQGHSTAVPLLKSQLTARLHQGHTAPTGHVSRYAPDDGRWPLHGAICRCWCGFAYVHLRTTGHVILWRWF